MSTKTAFHKYVIELRQLLQNARWDEESLDRPLKTCRLGECAGTCCHDGVYLNPVEAEVLLELSTDRGAELEEL